MYEYRTFYSVHVVGPGVNVFLDIKNDLHLETLELLVDKIRKDFNKKEGMVPDTITVNPKEID